MSELVIRIGGSERYFHGYGFDGNVNRPVFGGYNSGMKIYRDGGKWSAERRAQKAIEGIGSLGLDLFSDLEIVEVDKPIPLEILPEETGFPEMPAVQAADVPEVAPLVPVPESELGGWKAVDSICGNPPRMCQKEWNGCFEYAIFMPDGVLYFLPRDELEAWLRYSDERKGVIIGRIEERRKRKSPPGFAT